MNECLGAVELNSSFAFLVLRIILEKLLFFNYLSEKMQLPIYSVQMLPFPQKMLHKYFSCYIFIHYSIYYTSGLCWCLTARKSWKWFLAERQRVLFVGGSPCGFPVGVPVSSHSLKTYMSGKIALRCEYICPCVCPVVFLCLLPPQSGNVRIWGSCSQSHDMFQNQPSKFLLYHDIHFCPYCPLLLNVQVLQACHICAQRRRNFLEFSDTAILDNTWIETPTNH